MQTKRLKIAIQKNGRLTSGSLQFLKSLGFDFDFNSSDLLIKCKNYPIDICMVRNSDITDLVNKNIFDLGITGKNLIDENNNKIEILSELNFANCSLIIASSRDSNINTLSDLEGLKIATSYPFSLKKYLKKRNINANIITMNGSVEIAPSLGIANCICDITETGKSLEKNNLKIIDKILDSQAVLIKKVNTKKYYENLFV